MYDYEEEFTTEEQDIVNEAIEKFHNVLIKKHKEEYEAYQSNKKYYEEAISRLHGLRDELEKEKRAFEASRDTLYTQFKKDWFNTLGFQFKVGDRVWYIHHKYKQEECPICLGTKEVEIHGANGDIITCKCPVCGGKGYNSVGQNIPKSGTIREIRTMVVCNKQDCYVDSKSLLSYSDKHEIRVSSDDSGEDIYRIPERLYHTKEECEAVIEQEKEEKEKKQ